MVYKNLPHASLDKHVQDDTVKFIILKENHAKAFKCLKKAVNKNLSEPV
jgi:hypothetical protein